MAEKWASQLALKSWHFEASEDIMTKFKSQGLHNKTIKYWNASGSGSTPSFIPAHWNIGILLHKQAKRRTIMHTTVAINWIFCAFSLKFIALLAWKTTEKTWKMCMMLKIGLQKQEKLYKGWRFHDYW